MRQARGGVILSSLRVAEFESARDEAEKLIQESPRAPESLALYGDALWASGLFEQAEAKYQEALDHHARAGSRPARPGALARGARPARSGDGQGAGRPASGAPRPRDSPHRRLHLRADAQVRGSGRRVHQLRQPAAEQGHQLQGQLVARRDPVPALVRRARAVRGRARHRRQDLHGPVQAGERQGRRPGQGERRARAGLRGGHRVGAARSSRGRRRSASASCRSRRRSAPASATSGSAACSSRASTRWRSASSSCATSRA